MSAPLAAPGSENLTSTLARDWAFQVDTSDSLTGSSPEWAFVLGLSQFSPVVEATMQDDGDINSGGYASEIPTELKLTVEAQGLRKGEKADELFEPDPGQELLRVRGGKLGGGNFVRARYWRTDGRAEATEGIFTVKWVDGSEGKDGLSSFTATLTSRGKPKDIPVPTEGAGVGG